MTEKSCRFDSTASLFVLVVLTLLMLMPGPIRAAEDSGLTVGDIEIDSRDIFSRSEIEHTNGLLRIMRKTMNGVHFNTRNYVVRRELLFQSGDPFVENRLAETERNLRRLGYLNEVRVTAVDTTADGRVNIRVSARETWTLRTSFSFSIASGDNQRWNVSLSDKNFLGHGVTLGGGLGQDENASYWNVWFRQQRLLGTDLRLGVDYSKRQDGYLRQVFLSRPFYAYSDPWMADLKVWSNLADNRYYLSNAGQAGADPTRNASLYARIPFNDSGFEGGLQFRLTDPDDGRIWRLGAGVRVRETVFDLDQPEYELSDGRYEDLSFLEEPGQPFARDQGKTVYPYVWLHSLGRDWGKARFVLQYGATEDIPMDLQFDFKAGPSGGALGSTTGYEESRLSAEGVLTKWFRLGPGYLLFNGVADGSTGSSAVRTYRYDLVTGWVGRAGSEMSPWITRIFAEYGQGQNLLGSRALLLGLDRGMRTLEFDGMAGDKLARWNIEQGKAMPWEIAGMARMGFAAFYSGGRAWWRDEDPGSSFIRHEAGIGLRFGPTRSANSQIARLDLAWDLNGSGAPVITAVSRGFF